MLNINLVLKLNALNCFAFGTLFVLLPEAVAAFLSATNPAPKLLLLLLGVGLNLYGLFLLWLASKEPVPVRHLLPVAIGDFLWVLGTALLIVMKLWIDSSNGITAAGLVALLVGWFGWLQLQYCLAQKQTKVS